MHNKKIIITGVTGFIGKHLTTYLKQFFPSCSIIGISRFPSLTMVELDDFYAVDILDREKLQQILVQVKPDCIFHLAGTVFSYDWQLLHTANVLGTLYLLEAVRYLSLNCRVIISGSAAEYGAISSAILPIKEDLVTIPHTPYGMTKLWQTQLAQYYAAQNVFVAVGRIFNVIGKGTSERLSTGSIFSQINRIMQGKQEAKILVGNLKIKRDFIDIADACAALIAIAQFGLSGSIYNVCAGYSVSFENILDLSLHLAKIEAEIIFDQKKPQNNYVQDIYGCSHKIRNEANWQPNIGLQDSIANALGIL